MGLFGMMRTSISGMQAQSNRLSTVADNIANSDTTGYKRAYTEFSQLVGPTGELSATGTVGSGGALTILRHSVADQGTLNYTNSATDLAIDGGGFFVVQNPGGSSYLTRSGSFIPDHSGHLVNSAGMVLAGYSLENGPPAAVSNGYAGLEPISITEADLKASPSTQGVFSANLPSDVAISTADLPSSNSATAEYTQKTSLVVYDTLGAEKLVDIYFTKTAAEEWEISIYNQEDAAAGAGFPYANLPLATQTMTFNHTDGRLAAGIPTDITITVPGGEPVVIDLENMTQLATDYIVSEAKVNGNSPSPIIGISFDPDGTVYARYGDGTFRGLYRIPLATVTSPDQLTAHHGSIFVESQESGTVQFGFPDSGKFGKIESSALEQSNVRLADELTTMIQAQRGYTANSKVFQTGSELIDVLVNLAR